MQGERGDEEANLDQPHAQQVTNPGNHSLNLETYLRTSCAAVFVFIFISSQRPGMVKNIPLNMCHQEAWPMILRVRGLLQHEQQGLEHTINCQRQLLNTQPVSI